MVLLLLFLFYLSFHFEKCFDTCTKIYFHVHNFNYLKNIFLLLVYFLVECVYNLSMTDFTIKKLKGVHDFHMEFSYLL